VIHYYPTLFLNFTFFKASSSMAYDIGIVRRITRIVATVFTFPCSLLRTYPKTAYGHRACFLHQNQVSVSFSKANLDGRIPSNAKLIITRLIDKLALLNMIRILLYLRKVMMNFQNCKKTSMILLLNTKIPTFVNLEEQVPGTMIMPTRCFN